jgi:hypothetical protein
VPSGATLRLAALHLQNLFSNRSFTDDDRQSHTHQGAGLFLYVFGSAIHVHGISYKDYLFPGGCVPLALRRFSSTVAAETQL